MDRISFEPDLNEILDDPIVQAVMARDGLDRDSVLQVMDSLRQRLELGAPQAAG